MSLEIQQTFFQTVSKISLASKVINEKLNYRDLINLKSNCIKDFSCKQSHDKSAF